mmetsp:Transcript_8956/g.17300  ORF Transcript_8956/g.17300 Transcript_8956/m.17300 type:complete len:87 (+) Transcript_8956:292-552(+)
MIRREFCIPRIFYKEAEGRLRAAVLQEMRSALKLNSYATSHLQAALLPRRTRDTNKHRRVHLLILSAEQEVAALRMQDIQESEGVV